MTRLVASLVAVLLVVGSAGLAAQQKGTIIQRIIVKVNGEIFTQTDLEDQQILMLQEKNQKLRSLQDLPDTALSAALAEVTPDVLVEAVDGLLVIQRARELGGRFTDENFKQAIENVKKLNKMDDEGLARALKEQGWSMADLRENFERTYLVQYLQQQEVMRNMNLTEQEARQYYAKHPEAFMQPATVTIRELFVAVPSTPGPDGKPVFSAAANEEGRQKIDAARARLLKGEDFALVAADVSDSGTKANGGLIGTVVETDLNPTISAILAPLKAGEVSEPIRTETGYQLFKVDARSAQVPEPFEKVRDQISQRIAEERMDTEMKKVLDRLRESAIIEWRDPAYRQMYEKRRAELAAASKNG